MAAQAFALSPISARASLPSEEDYEAIREAFMETTRGRWFLDEYARRNRNADTRMVLDAVSRIEQTLAAQKQPPPPIIIDRLPAALAAIRNAVERADGIAFAGLDQLRLEESLAPIRKGSRIIKEISWRWREIGADGRICDLIDAQLAAIEAGCDQLAKTDPRVALRAAFEIIRNEIEAFRSGGAAPPARPGAPARPVADVVAAIQPAAEVVAAAAPAPAFHDVATAPTSEQETSARGHAKAPLSEAKRPPQPLAEETVSEAEPAALSQEEADAQDEAVLEMVAVEMAAPDPDDVDKAMIAASESADVELMHVTTLPLVEPVTAASAGEPEPPPVETPPARLVEPPLSARPSAPKASVEMEPVPEPSLGSTIIASGILRRPNIPANDPLAPIRRMSQAEKIALFS